MEGKESSICKDIPSLLSSFVDTFVDFSVSGRLFLPCKDPKPPITPPPPETTVPLHTRHPRQSVETPQGLVAIGELHCDLGKLKQALRLAGLIDGSEKWVGGSTTVVQVGDVLYRGGEELKIFYFLEKLKVEAAKSGGKGGGIMVEMRNSSDAHIVLRQNLVVETQQ